MQITSCLIIDRLHEPEELESLYRQDPDVFREAIDEAIHASPDSIVLHVWRARLEYNQAVLVLNTELSFGTHSASASWSVPLSDSQLPRSGSGGTTRVLRRCGSSWDSPAIS